MSAARLACVGIAPALLLWAAGCGPPEADPCATATICAPDAPCFEPGCDAEARCRHGLEARYHGRSQAEDGTCVATDDAACRASAITCAVWGQCSAPPADFEAQGPCPERASVDVDLRAARHPGCAGRGTCVALEDGDCRASQACALLGRCVARDGICVALSGVDCKRSLLCADLGLCTQRDGGCVAASASDCAGTEACERRGECGASRGACVRCGWSEGCRGAGRCAYEAGRCVTCADSTACRREGLCRFAAGECRATTPDHCERSAACRDDGRCRLDITGTCRR